MPHRMRDLTALIALVSLCSILNAQDPHCSVPVSEACACGAANCDATSCGGACGSTSSGTVDGTVVCGPTLDQLQTQIDQLHNYIHSSSGASFNFGRANFLGCGNGWTGFGQFLNWRVRNGNLDHAILSDGSLGTAIAQIGHGVVHTLDFDPEAGFRGGIGYGFGCGWELGAVYTNFSSDASESIADPTATGGEVALTRGTNIGHRVRSVDSRAEFDIDVIDLNLSRWFVLSDCSEFRVYTGLRFADIDQALRIDYLDEAGTSNFRMEDNSQIDAFGMNLGFESRFYCESGLGFYFRGGGSLLVGEYTRTFDHLSLTNGSVHQGLWARFDESIPVLEGAAGVMYVHGSFVFSVGYEMSHWFNIADRFDFPSVLGGADTDRRVAFDSHDVMLDGLTAGVEFYF